MKKHWLFAVALMLPHVTHAAPEAPFAPSPNVPDFIATMTVKLHHGPTFKERHTHHGGWTRVDGSFDQMAYRSTSYFGPHELFISFAREPSDPEATDWLYVMRGPAMSHLIRWGDGPSKTGEAELRLGEACEVWNLKSDRRSLGANVRQLSCVTSDGIEMWWRVDGSRIPADSFEVTALTRKPVARGDVRPPPQRLNLQSWLTATGDPARPSNAPDDATVVLKRKSTDVWTSTWAGHTIQTRTVRRHYPWTCTEDTDDKGWLRTRFRHEIARLEIEYERDATNGPIRLSIQKALSDRVVLRDDPRRVLDTSRGIKTILGETCSRFEQQDRDGSSSECRTEDGLRLEEFLSTEYQGGYDLSAVKIDRGPVNPEAVLPPREIFVWSTWGVPD